MSENMMCPAHKASNEKSREGWEKTFGKKKKEYLTTEELFGVWSEEDKELLNEACKPTACEENDVTDAVEILRKRYGHGDDKKILKKFIEHSESLEW